MDLYLASCRLLLRDSVPHDSFMLRRRSISSQRASRVSDAVRISFFSYCLLILNNESLGRNKSTGALFGLPSPFTGVGTEELYFITLVLILDCLFIFSDYLCRGDSRTAPTTRGQLTINLLIINSFTILFLISRLLLQQLRLRRLLQLHPEEQRSELRRK